MNIHFTAALFIYIFFTLFIQKATASEIEINPSTIRAATQKALNKKIERIQDKLSALDNIDNPHLVTIGHYITNGTVCGMALFIPQSAGTTALYEDNHYNMYLRGEILRDNDNLKFHIAFPLGATEERVAIRDQRNPEKWREFLQKFKKSESVKLDQALSRLRA